MLFELVMNAIWNLVDAQFSSERSRLPSCRVKLRKECRIISLRVSVRILVA
jgi:hypothetical protein